MSVLKEAKKYPIIILFFAVLAIFTIIDFVKPTKEMSEIENRRLTQAPAFTWSSFTENKWTMQYGEFVRDQFVLRDGWMQMHSLFEAAQGKLESGGVWLAQNHYQIASNTGWSTTQKERFPRNTQVVGQLAGRFPGKVYAMVVPSPAGMMSNLLRYNPPQVDEDALMDELYASMQAAGVHTVDLRESYRQALAGGQQVYYRTDHHWTTDGGARMAYEAYCEATGRRPLLPNAALRTEVPNFLGTNYSKTLWPGTLADTLVYYDLPNAMRVYKLETSGGTTQTDTTLMDKAKLDSYDKYAAFLQGNNGYSVIQGNGTGSILVIKDSYGNSFVPYLVESYATIGVIDLRAWGPVDDTIREGNYDEILVLYSFASFTEDDGIKLLGDIYIQ